MVRSTAQYREVLSVGVLEVGNVGKVITAVRSQKAPAFEDELEARPARGDQRREASTEAFPIERRLRVCIVDADAATSVEPIEFELIALLLSFGLQY